MLTPTVTGLSWSYVAVMATLPLLVAGLLAWPIWRSKQFILGNLAGSVVIFGSALALIMRESVTLDALTRACLDAGYTCWPTPSAFLRYAIYAGIGLIEVFAVFTISLRVEQRQRHAGYAPEWRR